MVNNVEFAYAIELLDRAASPAIVDRALHEAGLTRKSVLETTGFLPYRLKARVVEYVARAIGDANIGAHLLSVVMIVIFDLDRTLEGAMRTNTDTLVATIGDMEKALNSGGD